MTARRRLLTVVLAMLVPCAVASPAGADPAGPTHYRSIITAVESADGSAPPIEVEVLGGDAFLSVRAEPGTTVEVPGYEGEPYLRIGPDGTVEVNERSPARWLNDARYGTPAAEVPPIADAEAPPTWTWVAVGGEYAWHDHRIHYMSPSLPDVVDPSAGTVQPVFTWPAPIPLVVDGTEVTVDGELVWIPGPPSVVPIAAAAVAIAAATAWFVRRERMVGPAVLVAAAAAAAIGLPSTVGLTPGADGRPALVVLPSIAIALVVLARWRRQQRAGGWLAEAAGVPVLVWGLLQLGALTRPIVPGPVPVVWVRVVTVATLAVGAGALLARLARTLTTRARWSAVELAGDGDQS